MLRQFEHWLNHILSVEVIPGKIFIYLPECGLGDKITCFPAFRLLKQRNPDKKIVLVTEESVSFIWKLNKYIDYMIPVEVLKDWQNNIFIREKIDIGKICYWTFFEHHQQNVIKSCVYYIAGFMPDEEKDDLTYEFELTESQLNLADQIKNDLLERAKGKRIFGITPANTMFSRTWPMEYYIKLVNYLKDLGYYTVALGGKNDLEVPNVDYDARDRMGVAVIPKVLDIFDYIQVVNNGMLHIAFVNQDVKIVYLNTGQYPEKIMLPYRKQNNQYHNVLVFNHNCFYKEKCFEGHITNREITKQMNNYLKDYYIETGKIFPQSRIQLLQKYTCWFYCYKEKDKYSCNKQITPEQIIQRIEEDSEHVKKVHNF